METRIFKVLSDMPEVLNDQQIDTMMHYVMVNQTNIKMSHRKFMA